MNVVDRLLTVAASYLSVLFQWQSGNETDMVVWTPNIKMYTAVNRTDHRVVKTHLADGSCNGTPESTKTKIQMT